MRGLTREGDCACARLVGSRDATVKNEVGERFESHGDAKGQLFDYIEVFYIQRAGIGEPVG